MSHANLPNEIRQCIDACASCHQVCVDGAIYCLAQGGTHAAAEHVQVLLDCEHICGTTEDFMLRLSTLHGDACDVCAKVCDACATSCEQFPGDAQMTACALECRSCAAACRRAGAVPMPLLRTRGMAKGSP
jgi:hypothetical protein